MTNVPSSMLGPPTLGGLQQFLLGNGFSTTVLPAESPVIQTALNVALGICSTWLNYVDPDIYTLAVYNLATDRIVNFAQDQPGQNFFSGPPPSYQPPGLRQQFGIFSFQAGPVEAAADQGTSTSMAVSPAMQNLSILDLQTLKTPWGRTYMGFAQQIGTLWGLT